MRDGLILEENEVAFHAAVFEVAERCARELGRPITPLVGLRRKDLQAWLDVRRADGRDDATTRLLAEVMAHDEDEDELIDTEEAARVLGISVGAVAKRCRRGGMFAAVAHQSRGRWLIPRADVQAVMGTGAA